MSEALARNGETAVAPGLSDFMPGGVLSPEPDSRVNLIGQDRDGLTALVAEMGEPAFRAKQLYHWIYMRGAKNFADMTNLSKAFRAKLEEKFRLDRPRISAHQKSVDGTQKWLLRYEDGNEAEMVFIPETDRGTLCISSQVGCSLTCAFCHTGTQMLVRNLTPGDIAGQVMLARDELDDWAQTEEAGRKVTNIVLMGMGEPLYNTDNVMAAMRLVSDGDGIAIGRRKITLSTSGVVPDIQRVGEELGLSLAISLHAVRDDLRDKIVPINRKYPIAQLMETVKGYPGLTTSRRVTWEYVMLKGVNDSDEDARTLLRLMEGIPSKVNLIPFNPWPGSEYECSDPARVESFLAILHRAGMVATIRKTRGQDILAACGQLKSESQRIGKRERDRLASIRAEKEAAVGL
ncbi:23S rRNA (adenine(2503)-C(2))-methyltransferase RlmN [Pacificispira spongiicola]|nr:23S rRNA (adenine(2503)-C(2))-methyltransferase RlmN [Pacificispira spongiicola]